MDQVQFLIRQQIKQLESDCFSRRSQIDRAQSIPQVVRASEVHIKSEIRFDPGARRAAADIKDFAEKKLLAMVGDQLRVLSALDTEDQLKAEYGKLMTQEWRILSGNFPRVFRKVQDSLGPLMHKLAQSPTQSDDMSPS